VIVAFALVAALQSGDAPVEKRALLDLQALVDAAPPGATLELEPGTYAAPVHVRRAVTLRGHGRAVLDAGGAGDILLVDAADVVVEGLVLRGTGASVDRENSALVGNKAPRLVVRDCVLQDVLFGVHLKQCPDSVVAGNTIRSKPLEQPRRGDAIRLWQSSRVVVEDNDVDGSRDVVVWYSQDVILRRNHVAHGRYGMHFMYSSGNVLEDNVLVDNSVGAFLMYSKDLTMRRNVLARNDGPSGFGVGLKDMDGLVLEDNVVVGNRVGLHLDNSPMVAGIVHRIRRNVFAYNDVGVAFMPNVKGNQFTENSFLENVEQVAILGNGDALRNPFAVAGRGNYWSDYRGFDLDHDGVGDIEYRADALFEDLVDRDPRMRLFLFSPAQHAIGMAARAFPIVAPRPKIVDPSPLLVPHATPVPPGAQATGSGGLSASLLLFALATLAIVPAWCARRELVRTFSSRGAGGVRQGATP
jgi:nitrous oxidase accessory protein